MKSLSLNLIADQGDWHKVSANLESEELKLASYDNTLISIIGDISEKNILDYGAGSGILASCLEKIGANVKAWDINPEMRKKAAQKIGQQNVYSTITNIPEGIFDIIICNLVLCIVSEAEVRNILGNINKFLSTQGVAYLGFCNPKIFDIPESALDFRLKTGCNYHENHSYKKIKKEGLYAITESHRPIEWYEMIYSKVGLKITDTFFTPQYKLKGNTIEDFVIFKVAK